VDEKLFLFKGSQNTEKTEHLNADKSLHVITGNAYLASYLQPQLNVWFCPYKWHVYALGENITCETVLCAGLEWCLYSTE
jgi:hypothetical protein